MAEFNAGTLYEMNKTLVAKWEKQLRGKALTNKINNEVIPYLNDKVQDNNYFMLLCHEKRDYTVFNLCLGQHFFKDKINDLSKELLECLQVRGKIFGIDKTEDGVALEIWIQYENDENEMVCYYFFPYDQGVIEV